jgi:hypothetical protein
MFMNLRRSCFRATVEEIEALHSSKGKDGVFEVIFIERIGLWFKFLCDN